MPENFSDKVDRVLRDHEGYTGDGQGGIGSLPGGDRATARRPISKRDLRELLKASDGAMNLAEANGYTDAVAEGLAVEIDEVRDLAFDKMKIYSTVAAGQAATPVGESFSVQSSDPDVELYVYRKTGASTSELVAATPSTAALATRLPAATFDTWFPERNVGQRMIPLNMDLQERIAIWLNDGDLDARGMARGLRDRATADIAPKLSVGRVVPLSVVGDYVATWLHPTRGFQAAGMVQSVTSADLAASEAQAALLYAPRVQPYGAMVPISTDGRSLHRFMSKIGQIKAGGAGADLRIAFTGDSWSELTNIPDALIALMSDRLAPGAGSYVQANDQYLWPGVSVAPSEGWTRQDASVNSDWPYGAGPDGQIYHATGDGETLTNSGIEGTSLRIYTADWGASWSYALNGGVPVPVTEMAGDGSLTVTVVDGLTAGLNSLVITKTGVVGRLVFCGLRNVRSTPVEVMKVGNGGLTGYRWRDYAPLPVVRDIWSELDPDLVICHLGTNDYRNGITPPSTYLDGIQAATAMLRAAVPGVGIIYVLPPQTGGDPIYPLSAYRDVLYQHCLEAGCEMLNLLDCWGPFDPALMADSLHLNPSGAALEIHHLNHHFLGV